MTIHSMPHKKTDQLGNFNGLDFLALIGLIVFGFVLYFHALRGSFFCLDDYSSIVYDPVIKNIDLPRIFNAFNTRFLGGLSFALNFQWCGLNPEGYRLINLIIHCLNAFLLYLLVKSTLIIFSDTKSVLFCPLEWGAFLGSMIFLCHPIQTEPVNYITQRFVLMEAFFYLLTLYLYVLYRFLGEKKYLIFAFLTAIAVMLCKEIGMTLPLMLTLYEFCFVNQVKGFWQSCKRIIPFFAIALIVPVLLLRTPSQVLGVANIANSNSDIIKAKYSINRGQYFLTELNVVRSYVRLLFLPIKQNFDYDYTITKAFDLKTLMSCIFLISLLCAAYLAFKFYRIITFSIFWFFIALSVESGVIPIGNVIAEYRLYLPSAAFAFLALILIYFRKEDQKKLYILGVLILIYFSMLTYQRNRVWSDEMVLWNDIIQKSPHKARPYLNRGNYYFRQDNFI